MTQWFATDVPGGYGPSLDCLYLMHYTLFFFFFLIFFLNCQCIGMNLVSLSIPK